MRSESKESWSRVRILARALWPECGKGEAVICHIPGDTSVGLVMSLQLISPIGISLSLGFRLPWVNKNWARHDTAEGEMVPGTWTRFRGSFSQIWMAMREKAARLASRCPAWSTGQGVSLTKLRHQIQTQRVLSTPWSAGTVALSLGLVGCDHTYGRSGSSVSLSSGFWLVVTCLQMVTGWG